MTRVTLPRPGYTTRSPDPLEVGLPVLARTLGSPADLLVGVRVVATWSLLSWGSDWGSSWGLALAELGEV